MKPQRGQMSLSYFFNSDIPQRGSCIIGKTWGLRIEATEKSHCMPSPVMCKALCVKLLSAEREYKRHSSYWADVIRNPEGRWGGGMGWS